MVLMSYIQWAGMLSVTCGKRFKTKWITPKKWTESNIETMKSQLKMLGLSIDWNREISTCDANYYKHQQEIFIDFLTMALSHVRKPL